MLIRASLISIVFSLLFLSSEVLMSAENAKEIDFPKLPAGAGAIDADEWSHRAVKDIVHHYDWHATLLQCFG